MKTKVVGAKGKEYHPIIFSLAEHQANPWWNKKLLEIAKGKIKKIVLRDNEVAIKQGTKIKDTFVFEDVDPDILSARFVDFLKKTCHIYSPSEKELMDKTLSMEQLGWSKLKLDQRDSYLVYFVEEERVKRGLSNDQASDLYHLLSLSINTKILNKDSFVLEGSRLVEIKGLTYEQGKYTVEGEIPKGSKTPKKSSSKGSPYNQKWTKYLEEIKKHNCKHLRKKAPMAVDPTTTDQTKTEEYTQT